MLASSSCSPPPLNLLATVSTTTKTQTLTLTRTRIQTRTRSISQSDPLRYCSCGRRHLLAASLLLPILPSSSQAAEITSSPSHIPTCVIDKFYPPKADWYEEFYAQATDMGMISYEAEIAGYKKELFGRLAVSGKSKNIVELGVGTGANFKYYASAADFNVIGVDPNKKMEKHARAAAVAAGLPPTNFTFIRGVGEALPIGDNSMDAVIGTLVLCSVKDVDISLKGQMVWSIKSKDQSNCLMEKP
ncbi:uncharacterized protein A4U43_C08F25190 [Asparagus officinalis]|nr:uncharacterized protein A4U43_C08F25190 [Asparagus officinalis]